MSSKAVQHLTRGEVPQSNNVIGTGSDEHLAVGNKCDAVHAIRVFETLQGRSRLYVPEPRQFVFPRDDALAVGMKGHCGNKGRWRGPGIKLLPGCCLPEP